MLPSGGIPEKHILSSYGVRRFDSCEEDHYSAGVSGRVNINTGPPFAVWPVYHTVYEEYTALLNAVRTWS